MFPSLYSNFSRYQDIIHSIHLARKPNLGLKSCDGNQELLNFLRSDLIEVATRLQKGGLGYVEETSEFEARVRTWTPSEICYSWKLNLELCPDTVLDFPRKSWKSHVGLSWKTYGAKNSLCTCDSYPLISGKI